MPHFEAERAIEILQIKNRLNEVWNAVYTQRQPFKRIQHCVTGPGKGPERAPKTGWKPFHLHGRWGGFDQTTWFRLRVTIPPEMKGKTVVALIRPAEWAAAPQATGLTEGGECLAYLNGKPCQGIDRNHGEILLTTEAKSGAKFEILLEACPSTRFDLYHHFAAAEVAVRNELPWDLYWDAATALEVVETLEPDYAPRRKLLELINTAVKQINLQHMGEAPGVKSLEKAQKTLRKGLKDFEASYGMGALTLAGHAHIDTAWLWPLRETKRKCARTFSTILRLMERYPEFHFSCSQPIQYEWIKTHYPELFESIRQRVKEGRWELCGAPWVEPDHNIPSGESLFRHYLYGNRWFQAEFGKRSHIAWVPDSFGYTWQLPQIMRKCQLNAFITTKIDWSQFSTFPYSMFLWEGADGTRIPAIMPPLNYNGDPTPQNCVEQWNRFKQKELVNELIFPIGYGDGGGGPTMDMIERGRRLENIVGIPQCAFGPIEPAVHRMLEQADPEKLPVYNGELYLELHRGCQTSQARAKRHNRQCETALHNAELLNAVALLHGAQYPAEDLAQAWKTVLTNQFHDILPGSSITEVYTQAEQDYQAVKSQIAAAQEHAINALLSNIDTANGEGVPVVVFNTLPWVRGGVLEIETEHAFGNVAILNSQNELLPHQKLDTNRVLFEAEDVPPLGYAVYRIVKTTLRANPSGLLAASPKAMENEFFRIELDNKGTITRIFDKLEHREVIPPGARANDLQLFEDRPHLHDAWDIDPNFEERQWEPAPPESIDVEEEGPVRAVLRIVRETGQSTITQRIIIYAARPRIDFHTRVDWREKRTLLKVAFPIDVRAQYATYEIQFGAIQRPTHRNHEQDYAKFEVPAQRWADLSEPGYGVSLLNDGKYGYDCRGNVLRLSLLRSPIDPDPQADQGEHEFTYALLPHAESWRDITVQEAADLNNPLFARVTEPAQGSLPPNYALALVDCENVIISNVKKHEDSDALIFRVYEACGQRCRATIMFAHTPKHAAECDGMEENDTPAQLTGNSLQFFIKPFEIRTFKVTF